jgi:hypothetical protein
MKLEIEFVRHPFFGPFRVLVLVVTVIGAIVPIGARIVADYLGPGAYQLARGLRTLFEDGNEGSTDLAFGTLMNDLRQVATNYFIPEADHLFAKYL